MRGMWAAWLAAGELERVVDGLLNAAYTTLLIEIAAIGLDDAQRGIVLRDFDAARRHIWMTLVIKLSFWRLLPWT